MTQSKKVVISAAQVQIDAQEVRMIALENAVKTINHFTETMTVWRTEMTTDLKWVKLLLKLAVASSFAGPIAGALLLKALLGWV